MNKKLLDELKTLNTDVVVVSKKRTSEQIDEVANYGFTTFGENRVQEFLEKYNPKYTWHIIGHLQTNKVKYVVGKVDMIQSLDSIKLAKEIEKQAAKQDLVQKVLVELHISDDETKTGLPVSELESFMEEIKNYPHILVKGFMCVAGLDAGEEKNAQEFDQMKEIFDRYQKENPQIDILSMGMSQDYKLAIEHGSTMVRIGTAIFVEE